MMIPPIWINVRVGWAIIPVPVILFWPIVALAWLILCVAVTAFLVANGSSVQNAGSIWGAGWKFLCSLRGTLVEVEQPGPQVRVSIW